MPVPATLAELSLLLFGKGDHEMEYWDWHTETLHDIILFIIEYQQQPGKGYRVMSLDDRKQMMQFEVTSFQTHRRLDGFNGIFL